MPIGPDFGYPQMGFALLEVQKSQISNCKYQTISNNRNSKIQTMSRPGRFWSRVAQALAPRVEYWILRPARSYLVMAGGFICNLVLGICDFRHKTRDL
jgi:hypothetical protein